MIRLTWILLLLMMVSYTQSYAKKHDKAEETIIKFKKLSFGGSVSGQFVGLFVDGTTKRKKQLGIPKTQVLLKSTKTGNIIKKTVVDALGYYRFSRLDAGDYQVCWERKGFGKGCAETIKITNKALFLPAVPLNKDFIDIRVGTSQRLDPELIEEILRNFRRQQASNINCKDAAGNDRFLFRKRNDINDDQARSAIIGEAYYNKIDPGNKKLTLGEWWRINGFDPITGRAPAENNGYKAAAVAYLNDNDLGFGRNMHCLKKNNTTFSCWVANHGLANQSPANSDLAAGYINPGATVTMEFSPFGSLLIEQKPDFSVIRNISDLKLKASNRIIVEKQISSLQKFNNFDFSTKDLLQSLLGNPTVKFYVYVPDSAEANQPHSDFDRTTAADLDGCEIRHVPGLCLNCHGGNVPDEIRDGNKETWTTADIREMGEAASFREFDTASFKYPGGRTSTNNVEDAMFKRLNRLILGTDPSDAIKRLIFNWYSSANDTSIDENYAPVSWKTNSADENAYVEVVGKACRTCHVALKDSLNWDIKTNLDTYGSSLTGYICGSAANMPHAKITTKNMTQQQRNTLLAVYNLPSCP